MIRARQKWDLGMLGFVKYCRCGSLCLRLVSLNRCDPGCLLGYARGRVLKCVVSVSACVILLLILFLHSSTSFAEGRVSSQESKSEVVYLDRIVAYKMPIASAIALVELGNGTVVFFDAKVIFLGETGRDSGQKVGQNLFRYLLACVIPASDLKVGELSYTFVIRSEGNANIAGKAVTKEILPVESRSVSELTEHIRSGDEYREHNAQLVADIEERQLSLRELQGKADELSDELIGKSKDFKDYMRLQRDYKNAERLRGELEERKHFLELMLASNKPGQYDVAAGGEATAGDSQSKDMKLLDENRARLSAQLLEVAQITARAERLNRLKRMSYLSGVRHKKNTIEQFANVDREALEFELASTRREREILESRLNSEMGLGGE